MKKCIVTYVDGDKFEEQLEITKPLFERYAILCDAELIVLRGKTDSPKRELDKFKASQVFREHDLSLFLDVDVVISNDSPNIFEIASLDKISALNEYDYFKDKGWFWRFNKPERVRLSQHMKKTEQKLIVNSGVFVMPKSLSHLYDPPEFPPLKFRGFEQSLFSCRIQDNSVLNRLDLKWNCIANHKDFYKLRRDAYFVHFNFKPIEKRIKMMKNWAKR